MLVADRRLRHAVAAAIASALPALAHAQSHAGHPGPTAAETRADSAVRAPLEAYLAGHATGGAEHFRRAFHPDARMWYLRDGTLTIMPIADYIAQAPGRPRDDEARWTRRIVAVRRAANDAMAEIVIEGPTARITDYMALMRDGERWVIVNKVVSVTPTSTAAGAR